MQNQTDSLYNKRPRQKSSILDQMFHDIYGKITAIMFAIDLEEKEMSKILIEQMSSLIAVYQSIYNEIPDMKSVKILAEKKKMSLSLTENLSEKVNFLCSFIVMFFYENSKITCKKNSIIVENGRSDYISHHARIESEIKQFLGNFKTTIEKDEKNNKITIIYEF